MKRPKSRERIATMYIACSWGVIKIGGPAMGGKRGMATTATRTRRTAEFKKAVLKRYFAEELESER